MRTPRIYINQELNENTDIALPKETVLHLAQVLKKKMGNNIILFNGQLDKNNQFGEYLAEVTSINKYHATASIKQYFVKDTKSSTVIELAQCISKSQHFEITLQKAVELGADIITPVISERSEQMVNQENIDHKVSRWKKIILSACEQSGRTNIPVLNSPLLLTTWLSSLPPVTESHLLLSLCTKTTNSLHDIDFNNRIFDQITIIIGPEGGIADKEIDLLATSNFQMVKLGSRIMRTETAGIASLAVIQYLTKNL